MKESLKAVLAQAHAAIDMNDFVQGVTLFTRACEMDSSSRDAWSGRAYCLKRLPNKNLEEVERCWRRVLEIKPNHRAAHNDLADLLENKGDVDGTEKYYRRALVIDPHNGAAH